MRDCECLRCYSESLLSQKCYSLLYIVYSCLVFNEIIPTLYTEIFILSDGYPFQLFHRDIRRRVLLSLTRNIRRSIKKVPKEIESIVIL